MKVQERGILSERFQLIKPKDFAQVDIGIYEFETKTVVWENKTDILITCWEVYTGYGYDDQVLIQCANQTNTCLYWIEEQKEYIQKIVSEKGLCQLECDFEMAGKNFFDKLCLGKVEIEISVHDEIPLELLARMYIDTKPFFPSAHCHCIEAAIRAKGEGTYEVDIIEDMQRLLLEIRDALKEKDAAACEWAKNNGIFHAFDDEGNMLAVVRQQFCLSMDHKLIAETDDEDMKKKGFSGNKPERSALYFIRAKWKLEEHSASLRKGLPMPFGFVPKELICKEGVFTITPLSGHEAVSGTFPVMQEALTMIEMLYRSRGVTEEEINKCYYTFLAEDHQKYLNRFGIFNFYEAKPF